MGERIKHNQIVERWQRKMPRFFYWLMVIAVGVGGGASAINIGVPATGGVLHDWWTDLYPYIFGTSIGITFACKFTVGGGYKSATPNDILRHGDNTVLDQDIDHLQADSPEQQ